MLKKYFCVLAALLLVLSSGVVFAGGNNAPATKHEVEGEAVEILGVVTVSPTLSAPNQVQRYAFSCTASSYVRVGIRDYGLPGDIWEATFKVYDATPTQARIEGTGSITAYKYGHLWGVYSYAMNPLRGFIEVRYHQGINVFPASPTLEVFCPGTLTLTNLGLSNF